jgi:hypothetical protein
MASAQPLVDHDRIREWAEARGARPACVKGTGGKNDPGMLRLDFPGYSGEESLQPISWNDWFRRFDERNLALLVQEKTARGGRMSNFNKLVERRSSGTQRSAKRSSGRTSQAGGRKSASRRASASGTRTRTSTARGASKSAGGARKSARSTAKPARGARKSARGSTKSARGGTKRASGRRASAKRVAGGSRKASQGGTRRRRTSMAADVRE